MTAPSDDIKSRQRFHFQLIRGLVPTGKTLNINASENGILTGTSFQKV